MSEFDTRHLCHANQDHQLYPILTNSFGCLNLALGRTTCVTPAKHNTCMQDITMFDSVADSTVQLFKYKYINIKHNDSLLPVWTYF